MRKVLYYPLIGIMAIVVSVLLLGVYRFNFTDGGDIIPGVNVSDPKNATYLIGGSVFNLKNGYADMPEGNHDDAHGALRLFGEPVYGDLDADGDLDAAVLLVNTSEGSGTFYYAALVFNQDKVISTTTKGMLLGDRIAPQTVEIREGRAVYNYAIRAGNEPMTAQPSIGKSTWVHYDAKSGEIGEWVKDFEGESSIINK